MADLSNAISDFRSRFRVPAVGGAMLSKAGELSVEVEGVTERGGDVAVDVDDVWHIGSCCKSMTAAAYARLVESGRAAWGVPIGELVGSVADSNQGAGTWIDPASVDPGWNSVTVDQVLTHTGGVRANLTMRQTLSAWKDERPVREQRHEVAERILTVPPDRPGRFRYSNLSYILVGHLIEAITGTDYEAALGTLILDPIGITSAGFGPPPRPSGHGGRLKTPVVHLGLGDPADPHNVRSDNPAVMGPAGRLHLTLEDWAEFQNVFLNDGAELLSPESVRHLLTPAPGKGPGQAMGWAPGPPGMGISVGQQGSNTMWMATAVIAADGSKTAMVVCNDGRSRLVKATGQLAISLLNGE
jgi:CubicO group peptidase (beta-lactamase class C family)